MPEHIHVSPDGVRYRLIATRTTTPTTDSEVKEIRTETDSVEVIVSDSRLVSRGSQFGHVAIIVDGIAYSRAHRRLRFNKENAQYVAVQESFGFRWLCPPGMSPQEKRKFRPN